MSYVKNLKKRIFCACRIRILNFTPSFVFFFKKNLVFSKLYMNTAVTNANTTVHIMESFEY